MTRRGMLTLKGSPSEVLVIGADNGSVGGTTINAGQYYMSAFSTDAYDPENNGATITKVGVAAGISNAYFVIFLDDFSIYAWQQVTTTVTEVAWSSPIVVPPATYLGIWVQNASDDGVLKGGTDGYFSVDSGLPPPPTLGVGTYLDNGFNLFSGGDPCTLYGKGYA